MMVWLRKKTAEVNGFSLPEVIISLFIFCCILWLGSLRLRKFSQQLLVVSTAKEVAVAIEQAGHVNAVNGQEINVSYFPKSHKLIFYGKNYDKHLLLNDQISIANLADFSIAKNGTVAPRTITFSAGDCHRKIRIQMNWGRIIYEAD